MWFVEADADVMQRMHIYVLEFAQPNHDFNTAFERVGGNPIFW